MTVLITGGMGFIGLHTARSFVDAGEDVVITWYQTWREPDFIKGEYGKRVILEQADVSQGNVIRDLAKKYDVGSIVHLAVPGVGALDAAGDYHINMDGLIGVLEAAREAEVARLSIASSIACYHSMDDGPYRETDRLPVQSANPTEAYKKAWEILALHYANRTGINIVNLRIGGIWGPLYHSGMNLPSRTVHAAVKGVDPAYMRDVVPHSEDIADICYVKDTAEGIRVVHTAAKLDETTYNVGMGVPTTNGDIESAIKKVIPSAKVNLQPGKSPGYKKDAYMDTTRLRGLGFKPTYTIDSAIAEYIEWLRAGNEK